jgi:biopolymer transport protein ExbD
MSDGDEAVAVNVTPLIDIIFCLCLFFLCSLKFKQLEGKMDAWLPKDVGTRDAPVKKVPLDEIRIFVRLDASGVERLAYGAREVADLDELARLAVAGWADACAQSRERPRVVVDGESKVEWRSVVAVVDRLKRIGIESVELTQPDALAAAPARVR